MEAVASFLNAHGLGSYVAVFRENGYDDLELLRELDDRELEERYAAADMMKGHAVKLKQRRGEGQPMRRSSSWQ